MPLVQVTLLTSSTALWIRNLSSCTVRAVPVPCHLLACRRNEASRDAPMRAVLVWHLWGSWVRMFVLSDLC